MSDGTILIDLEVDPSNAKNQAKNDAKAYGDSFASGLDGVEKATGKVGSALTKYVTAPAVAAGTALAGVTLAKGWDRLMSIDTARAKLEGLGHSAESVAAIQENALNAVRGTAFGLGEAVSAAASAVAAGIEEGEDLERYLSLIGDTAAIAGTEFESMGSIFGKIQTNGKATMQELGQLADQGIPIYQWLAEEIGVTAEEVAALATDGEISSEMFLAAVEKNIGGAAKIIGEKSLAAALKNVGASIGRIGAAFLDAGGEGEGFFGQIQPLLIEFMGWLDSLADKAAGFGEVFGAAFALIVERAGELLSAFKGVDESWTESLGAPDKEAVLESLNGLIDGMISGFDSVNEFLGQFGTNISEILPKVLGIGIAAGPVLKLISGAAGLAAGAVKLFGGAMGFASFGVIGLIAGLVGLIAYLSTTDKSAEEIAESFSGIVDSVMENVVGLLEQLPEIISGLIETVVELLPAIVETLVAVLPELVTALVTALVELVPILIEGFVQLFMAFIEALPTIIESIVSALPQIVTAIIEALIVAIPALVQGFIQLFFAFIDALPTIITTIAAAIPQIITAIISALAPLAGDLWDSATEAFGEFVSGIQDKVSDVVAAAVDLGADLLDSFLSLPGAVYDIGVDIITGMVDGISSMVDWAVGKITAFGDSIVGGLKSFFGIASPSKLMEVEIGYPVGQGVAVGFEKVDPMKQIGQALEAGKTRLDTSFRYQMSASLQSSTRGYQSLLQATQNGFAELINKDTNIYVDKSHWVGGTIDAYDQAFGEAISIGGF